ncbi:MAG: SDR family NAD(P)-dependent oxidoreductase, partial [Pseudomonadota bacterium]
MNAPIAQADVWVAIAFLPILAATAVNDLRDMKIPNRLSWMGLGLFALCLPIIGWDDWGLRAIGGGIAFFVCFCLFAAGWFGGGDAKILPVTFLFVPTDLLPLYLFSFSAAMMLGMAGMWLVRTRLSQPGMIWVSLQPGAAFPMGISIAASLPLMWLGFIGLKMRAPYVASKHALEGYTDVLRIELRDSPIHVVLIEPGPIKTDIR